MSAIFFMKMDQPYAEFTNFFKCEFTYEGRIWKSSEHCYQAMKFDDFDIQEIVRAAPSAMGAAITGRNPKYPIKHNWNIIKETVMMNVLRAKFNQNPYLKKLLLSTGNRLLVELSYKDPYWGTKPDMSGMNRLGVLLMQLREEITIFG